MAMSSAASPALQGAGFVRWAVAGLLLSATACASGARTISARDASSPLRLQREIALPGVKGRIDHLAVDLAGERLFVAEVANGSVEVLDLAKGTSVARVGGLHEPQGIGWIPAAAEFVVACGDGTVHFYSGRDYRETAAIDLGADADDVRIDPRNGRVVVGYGEGGLAVVDPAAHRVISRVTFKGHPEGFALAAGKAWVNDPDDGAVIALDLDAGTVLARWPTHLHRLNFPMGLSGDGKQIAIAYRLPAALARIDAREGRIISMQDTCGDSDDLYFAGPLILVVCGAGHVDLVEDGETKARVETRGGARTGLYVPELGSLFVALPARGNDSAAVWELRLNANARSG
jgi:DNA-binding beta-propeller fold protein YncE